MIIQYLNNDTEQKVGKLTAKQAKLLYEIKPILPESRKLFNGKFNRVELTAKADNITVVFKQDKEPGFLAKVFKLGTIKLIQNDWINSPVLNRSGLAALLWKDQIPNKLRRRLENRVKFSSFTDQEKAKIIEELDRFVRQVKSSLNYS